MPVMFNMYFYYNKTYVRMAIVNRKTGGESYGNDNDTENPGSPCRIG